ncbi:MAG TPA: hypothetical protein VFW50_04425 [Streptosporangiaceae bacterium]|nr:hypothetical protein [Streptosporangiaceae bacterium]
MKLTPLRPLYDSCGDYVSVYLDTGRAHDDVPAPRESIGATLRYPAS